MTSAAAWIPALGAIALAALIVIVPGWAAMLALRVRGLAALALAPVATVALAGVSAVVLNLVRVPWALWSFGAVALVVIGVCWLLGRMLGAARAASTSVVGDRWLAAAIAVGAVVAAVRMAAYIGVPDAISQTNDAVFHLNAIRFIEETGSASSLTVSQVIGGSGFYPAAWHALVSLVALTAAVPVAIAANAMTLVITGVWTVGIAYLARAATGSRQVAAYAALFSGLVPAFPLLMFQWGVLYPNGLSIALMPAALALVLRIPERLATGTSRVGGVIESILLIAMAAAALALSQPAALPVWLLLALIWATFRALTAATMRARVIGLAAVLVGWAGLAVLWYLFSRSTSGAHWAVNRTRVEAIGEVLSNSQSAIVTPWILTALMFIGLVAAALRKRTWWMVVAWAALSAMYVLLTSMGRPELREILFNAWYADHRRITALAPLLVVPLAALGVDALARLVARLLGRTRSFAEDSRASAAVGGAIAVVITVVLVAVAAPTTVARDENGDPRPSAYEMTDETYLSDDEKSLLARLDELVPAGSRVIANPSTGSGFGYMLSGRDVYPRTWAPPTSDAWWTLADHLRDAATDPAVCEALAAFHDPRYVLDFGEGATTAGKYVMPGMTDFAGQEGFREVAHVGDAQLWEITACAR